MKKFVVIGLLVFLCALSAAAQSKKDALAWQTGKIIENQYQANVNTYTITQTDISKPVTDPEREKPKDLSLRDDTETVKIETADFTYTLTRKLKFIWQSKLKYEAGSDVKFALDGEDYIYLVDTKGKKTRYYISKIVNKRDAAGN